ncbi:hypothetical protein CGCSCA5_v014371 [Colletotrichum siamense]|uniref:Ricin B lectin domain-containing protein n=2 Tax=Colletotrichum gloeosporioides TaxID=474922 RepID=T0KYD0_COLGC|nr:uncharacterized protein GCG54_00014707 [Colletotrichum gloeosporioides]EQB57493.1 hypothetical protein CGLO_02380 [Colletotrichum gloeosporioides Cg-14]KAF4806465.1 hypothetical protein CGCSCA5_v014371 [Colletotrichum siamense]KAI8185341.1 hypothetical protein K4K51_011748 [Colletotrichum sp. SAR 10_75]KAI8195102.1 hypothetical protein KHU50_011134 [Colletotrichum sp. SAR 10_65]KAI8210977.1 hypothetical protein K4K52_011319 [Colletotrichum sp. SAR 10_76]KAI8271012.1 hypothetical protein K4
MKFSAVLSLALATAVAAMPTEDLSKRQTVQKGRQTLVFKEQGGVPGNECLTFRNNGEIVNAACVNTAADRQITPSTRNGNNVLLVQRSFTAGFRPDLVNKEVCVGFNGTAIRAEDCAARGIEFVSQSGNQLVASGGACLNGHDNAAQVTVSAQGQGCASFTTTSVKATAP